jgi:hypothetical protein
MLQQGNVPRAWRKAMKTGQKYPDFATIGTDLALVLKRHSPGIHGRLLETSERADSASNRR